LAAVTGDGVYYYGTEGNVLHLVSFDGDEIKQIIYPAGAIFYVGIYDNKLHYISDDEIFLCV